MEKKPGTNSYARLARRNLLKLLAALPAGAVFPVSLEGFAAPKGPVASPVFDEATAAYKPKVFTPHEWKTVHVLSDLIIPADERSGSATAAGVPEFIDDWLEFERGNLLSEIRGGLTWLDVESNRLFGHDFAGGTAVEQTQLLDRIAYPKRATPEDAGAVAFFNHFRDLVVGGFFTSEMGIRDLPYLGNEPRSEWTGCPSAALSKLGVGESKTGIVNKS